MASACITRKQAQVAQADPLFFLCMASTGLPSAGMSFTGDTFIQVKHCLCVTTSASCMPVSLGRSQKRQKGISISCIITSCLHSQHSHLALSFCLCRRDVLQPLSEQGGSEGCRVIAFDRPPYGLSERPLTWPEGPEGNPYTSEASCQQYIAELLPPCLLL